MYNSRNFKGEMGMEIVVSQMITWFQIFKICDHEIPKLWCVRRRPSWTL